jgi:hypothetical protein
MERKKIHTETAINVNGSGEGRVRSVASTTSFSFCGVTRGMWLGQGTSFSKVATLLFLYPDAQR